MSRSHIMKRVVFHLVFSVAWLALGVLMWILAQGIRTWMQLPAWNWL